MRIPSRMEFSERTPVSPIRTRRLCEAARAEFTKLLRSVQNNAPGLLEEMKIGRAGQKFARKTLPLEEGGGVMRTNGPLVTQHMLVFGAKLGFALHYEALKTIVPPTGGVASSGWWRRRACAMWAS
jgi:hypothetical protein